MTESSSFKTTGLMASGPAALAKFRLQSSLATPLTEILILGILGYLPLNRSGIKLLSDETLSITAL